MTRTYSILLVILLLAISMRQSTQLVVNRKFNILKDIVEMQMSPNGQMLGALNRTHVALYNSFTGHLIKLISQQTEPLTITFSKDSRFLAVSFANGNIFLYQLYNNSYQTDIKIIGSYNAGANDDGNVTSIVDACFTSDSKSMIFADKDGDIIRWEINGQVILGSFWGARPSKIACSQSDPNQFIISGDAVEQNKTALLKIFKFNTNTKKIQFDRSLNAEFLYYINYLAYGAVANQVYVLSNQHSVRVYELPEYNYTLFYQGSGEMFKLILGTTKDNFAVVNQTHIILEGAQSTNAQSTFIYATKARTMAMNPDSNRLLYIDESQKTNALDVCPEGSYFDLLSKKCQGCLSQCTVCNGNSRLCYECKPAHFLSQQTCTKCIDNCDECTSLQKCDKCADSFSLRNGLCVERGVQFWVFALIVGGFSLALCLVAVVNIIIMRRNQKIRSHKLLADPSQ